MKLQREVKIGFTLIVAIAILVWGVGFLKGKNVFDSGDRFYGVYSRVEGLTEGSPIFYKGYKIGTVQQIDFHPTQKGQFLISFSLTKKIKLPSNTTAQIYSLDLMGSKGVQLLPGSSNEMLQPGDTLNTNVMGDLKDQVSMEVLPLKDKTERLLVKLDTVLTNVGRVFSEENKKNLDYGIKNFSGIMENMEETTRHLSASFAQGGAIDNSLSNIDSITFAVMMQKENLEAAMYNLVAFSAKLRDLQLESMAASVDSSLNTISRLLQSAEEGEGSLGLLLSDNRLYLNMVDALANLDRLLADVRHNPGRYLHFSAIDLSPKTFVGAGEQKAEEPAIVFKLQVARASNPLEIKNQMVEGGYRIFEDTDGREYIYTVGETSSYREILSLKERIADKFPDARVVALEHGKPVKLKRVLRKIDGND